MMAAISSSLFNLGIILLLFSAIIYIIKNKLNEMDKRINSLSSLTEELLLLVNNKNVTTNYNITPDSKKSELVIVSGDDDDDDDDYDDDDDGFGGAIMEDKYLFFYKSIKIGCAKLSLMLWKVIGEMYRLRKVPGPAL